MSKIAVVTDSTADIDTELAKQKNIFVVPLNIHFAEAVYKDGVDLDSDAFFAKLQDATTPPRTSQPSPGEFHELYKSLLGEGYTGIISIHISRELSGTWQSAVIARDMLAEADILVVDTKSASMGTGLIVLNTLEKIQAGASLEEAASYAEWLVEQQKVLFGVATLEYLHRNGRIGRAAKLLGGFLNVKPVLHLDKDGFVAALAKVRGSNKFIPYLVTAASEFVKAYSGAVDLAVVHAQDSQLAGELLSRIRDKLSIRNFYVTDIGSVIGTHTGPGTIGIVLQKTDLP